MKKLFLFFTLPLMLNAQPLQHKIRVLFLGNSYTYVNNLPALVYSLALSAGDTLIYDSNCIGGYTFNNHCSDATSLAKIAAGNWDYVVLQAQSQEPSFPPWQVSSQTLPYAIKLDSLIKQYNPCAHTVFYETWGRKYGDQSNCAAYPPLCTYTGMQNRLRESYRMFADTVHDLMAPVGEAWRLAVSTNTVMDLYQADQSHPSLEGSYLAAAVLYETLFRHGMSSLYNPGINSGVLSLLNQCAHQLVTDSAVITNIPKYVPTLTLSISVSGMSVQFQSSLSGFSHHWYFDDGTSSTQVSPNHVFANPGPHTATLAVHSTNGCLYDSLVTNVFQLMGPTGMKELQKGGLRLYPNPCSEKLQLEGEEKFDESAILEIRNVLGEMIYKGPFRPEINVREFKPGIYYLTLQQAESRMYSCFIKNE